MIEGKQRNHPTDPDFDPLDEKYLADPYPYFERYRREAPVFYAPKIGFWVVSRYEDIAEIVKDPDTYSNTRVQEPMHMPSDEAMKKLKEGVRVVPTTSTADPPGHRRTRAYASRAFSAKRVATMEPIIQSTVDELIDDFIDDGRTDMVRGFAFPLPAQTIFRMIGIPDEDIEVIKTWCFDRLKVSFGRMDPDEELPTIEKMTKLFGYLENFVHGKENNLGDDFTSDLLRIRDEEGSDLATEEIVSMVYSLSFAGHETTTAMIANGLRRTLETPEVWEELRNDPSLIENATEEMLRHDTSVIAWRRATKKSVEIAEIEIPEGGEAPSSPRLGEPRRRHLREPPNLRYPPREREKAYRVFARHTFLSRGAARPAGGENSLRDIDAATSGPPPLAAEPGFPFQCERAVPGPARTVGGVDGEVRTGSGQSLRSGESGGASLRDASGVRKSEHRSPCHRSIRPCSARVCQTGRRGYPKKGIWKRPTPEVSGSERLPKRAERAPPGPRRVKRANTANDRTRGR